MTPPADTLAPSGAYSLRSASFRKEREQTWRRLERLVGKVESKGMASLTGEELAHLPTLYRATLSSLSVARAISLDRNVLRYLEGLSQRAYLAVYTRRRHAGQAVAEFVARTFPRSVRRFRWALLLATLLLAASMVGGYFLVSQDPETFHAFVDPAYASGRGPEASREVLQESLRDGADQPMSQLVYFSLYLFAHNAVIALMSFSLGFIACIPVFIMLLRTGLLIGAFVAVYAPHGLGVDIVAWLSPHGVTEILALLLAAAGGLALGGALIFPGPRRRLDQLADVGRAAGPLAIGAIVMLFLSGFLEGIVRQTVLTTPGRFTVAGITLVAWTAYLCLAGRQRRPGEGPAPEGWAAPTWLRGRAARLTRRGRKASA